MMKCGEFYNVISENIYSSICDNILMNGLPPLPQDVSVQVAKMIEVEKPINDYLQEISYLFVKSLINIEKQDFEKDRIKKMENLMNLEYILSAYYLVRSGNLNMGGFHLDDNEQFKCYDTIWALTKTYPINDIIFFHDTFFDISRNNEKRIQELKKELQDSILHYRLKWGEKKFKKIDKPELINKPPERHPLELRPDAHAQIFDSEEDEKEEMEEEEEKTIENEDEFTVNDGKFGLIEKEEEEEESSEDDQTPPPNLIREVIAMYKNYPDSLGKLVPVF